MSVGLLSSQEVSIAQLSLEGIKVLLAVVSVEEGLVVLVQY